MYIFNWSAKIIVTKPKIVNIQNIIKLTLFHFITEKEGKSNLI